MALGNDTVSSLDAALKTLWPQKRINTLLYKDSPLLGLLPKKKDFTGANMVLSTRYGGQQGRSAVFATAQANRSPTAQVKFLLTRVSDYGVGGMSGEAIRAAKGSEGSLIDGINDNMETTTIALKRSLSAGIYGNAGGAIGQISAASNVGTPTITLSNRTDVVNFEINQTLATSLTDGTSGAIKSGTVIVTAIDRDAGNITVSGNWTAGIATALASDYIFVAGDFGIKISGLRAWVPLTAPTATLFFGADRSPDPVRLGGVRFAATAGAPIEETLQLALARAFEHQAAPDHMLMNPVDLNKLTVSLGSKVIFDTAKAVDTPTIGYRCVVIMGPGGSVKAFADPSCPAGYAYALTLDTWTLFSLGECPGVLRDDGLGVLRDATTDTYQWRMGYYAQMGCKSPGENMVITL